MFEALETVAESFEAASISRQRWYGRFIYGDCWTRDLRASIQTGGGDL